MADYRYPGDLPGYYTLPDPSMDHWPRRAPPADTSLVEQPGMLGQVFADFVRATTPGYAPSDLTGTGTGVSTEQFHRAQVRADSRRRGKTSEWRGHSAAPTLRARHDPRYTGDRFGASVIEDAGEITRIPLPARRARPAPPALPARRAKFR